MHYLKTHTRRLKTSLFSSNHLSPHPLPPPQLKQVIPQCFIVKINVLIPQSKKFIEINKMWLWRTKENNNNKIYIYTWAPFNPLLNKTNIEHIVFPWVLIFEDVLSLNVSYLRIGFITEKKHTIEKDPT